MLWREGVEGFGIGRGRPNGQRGGNVKWVLLRQYFIPSQNSLYYGMKAYEGVGIDVRWRDVRWPPQAV